MEILDPQKKPEVPFEFNSTWLKDPSYIQMVNGFWHLHPPCRGRTWGKGFCSNLLVLKRLFVKWAKEKTKRDDNILAEVEQTLASFLDDQNRGFASADAKAHLIKLENQKAKILKDREET